MWQIKARALCLDPRLSGLQGHPFSQPSNKDVGFLASPSTANGTPGVPYGNMYFKRDLGRLGGSVRCPTLGFSSGPDLPVCEFEPHVGLHTVEPAWDSLSLSLSLSASVSLSLSLPLTLKKKKKNTSR